MSFGELSAGRQSTRDWIVHEIKRTERRLAGLRVLLELVEYERLDEEDDGALWSLVVELTGRR